MGTVTDFIDSCILSIQRYADCNPIYNRDIIFGETLVRLVFLDKECEGLFMPALYNTSTQKCSRISATIYIVNEARSNVNLSSVPWLESYSIEQDENSIWQAFEGEFSLISQPGLGRLQFYSNTRSIGVFTISDYRAINKWELPSPFRNIFHWIACDNNMLLLHSACVALNGKCILLTGEGGAGKSTTSLLMSMAGMKYISDDYCLVSLDAEIRAHHLYSTCKFFIRDRSLYSDIINTNRKIIGNLPNDKMAICIGKYPQIIQSAEISGMVSVVKSKAAKSKRANQPKLKSFLSLAPSTIRQAKGGKVFLKDGITRIVNELPSYKAELGVSIKDRISIMNSFLA